MKNFTSKKDFKKLVTPYLREIKNNNFKMFILCDDFKKDYRLDGYIDNIIVEVQACLAPWVYSTTGYYLTCTDNKRSVNTCMPSIYSENNNIYKHAYKSYKDACIDYLYKYFNN